MSRRVPNGESPERGLTARRHWRSYGLGILTESAFILALTVLAFLMAVVGKAVWR